MTRSEPAQLDVPAIGIHTTVIPIGLNPDGTVQVPPLQADSPVGWYRPLASPGEAGAAVLLGHVDTAASGPAVFYRLGQLRRGDEVQVSRADGSVAVFTVTSVVEYPKSAFPTAAVYGRTDHPSLRLVTCGGVFDTATGSYRDNIVAYADLTSQTPPPGSLA
jgi:sortase (surface protein transpeptidase)